MASAGQEHWEANWQAEAHVGRYGSGDRATGWAAWVTFAAVLLVLIGLFSVMEGVTALLNDDFYLVRSTALVVTADYALWGWLHVILGIAAIVVGAGVLHGSRFARMAAVVFAAVSALVHLAFLPAYPVWSALVIAFDVLVIYALTVRAEEVATLR
ncbi:hypothetical protein ACI784_16995 [Geodermatophilus sp. SYSU D01186]